MARIISEGLTGEDAEMFRRQLTAFQESQVNNILGVPVVVDSNVPPGEIIIAPHDPARTVSNNTVEAIYIPPIDPGTRIAETIQARLEAANERMSGLLSQDLFRDAQPEAGVEQGLTYDRLRETVDRIRISGGEAIRAPLIPSGLDVNFSGLSPSTAAFRISSAPNYEFGYMGFDPAREGSDVSGQVLFAGNLHVLTPRQHFRVTGLGEGAEIPRDDAADALTYATYGGLRRSEQPPYEAPPVTPREPIKFEFFPAVVVGPANAG